MLISIKMVNVMVILSLFLTRNFDCNLQNGGQMVLLISFASLFTSPIQGAASGAKKMEPIQKL